MPTKSRRLNAKPSLAGKRKLLTGLAAIGILATSALGFTILFAKDKPVVDLDKGEIISDPEPDPIITLDLIRVQEPSFFNHLSSYGWWIVGIFVVLGCMFVVVLAMKTGIVEKYKYRLNGVEYTIRLPYGPTYGHFKRTINQKHGLSIVQ